MAIECLLKGIYAKLCGPIAKNGHYKGVAGVKGHDLLATARAISEVHDLTLLPEEKDFVDRLSKNIIRGRYPIHKTWVHQLLPHAGGDRRRDRFIIPDHDNDLFNSVCAKLRGFLHEEVAAMYREQKTGRVEKK